MAGVAGKGEGGVSSAERKDVEARAELEGGSDEIWIETGGILTKICDVQWISNGISKQTREVNEVHVTFNDKM